MIRRVIGVLTTVAIVIGGAAVLESRAADEDHGQGAAKPVAALPAAVKAAATKSAADAAAEKAAAEKAAAVNAPGAKPAAAKAPAPGAPQVPEESATIRDDPTIVPDPKQSADNNVSFPTDI